MGCGRRGFSDGGEAEAAKKARNRRMDVQKFYDLAHGFTAWKYVISMPFLTGGNGRKRQCSAMEYILLASPYRTAQLCTSE